MAEAALRDRLETIDGRGFARPDLVVLGGDLAYPAASNYLTSSDPAVLADIARSQELREARKPPEADARGGDAQSS